MIIIIYGLSILLHYIILKFSQIRNKKFLCSILVTKELHVVVAEDFEEAEEALVEAVGEVEEDADAEAVIVVVVVDLVVEIVHVIIATKRVTLQGNALNQTAATDKKHRA